MPDAADLTAARSRSSGGAPAWPSVILTIPTYRRPEGLAKLLTHVGELTYKGALSVIVVENDAQERDGAAVVDRMSPAFRFPLTCFVEPRRGQTYAYNRGFLAAARALPPADYIAVLDDDEYPDRAWLTRMVSGRNKPRRRHRRRARCFRCSTIRSIGSPRAASTSRGALPAAAST